MMTLDFALAALLALWAWRELRRAWRRQKPREIVSCVATDAEGRVVYASGPPALELKIEPDAPYEMHVSPAIFEAAGENAEFAAALRDVARAATRMLDKLPENGR